MLVLGMLVVAGALLSPVRIGVVAGDSMMPTLQPGQPFLFRPHPVWPGEIQKGDVVLVTSGEATLIKRVFALAGQCFWSASDRPGDPTYPRLMSDDEPIGLWKKRFPGWHFSLHAVPPGCVFVLGDGVISVDSRQLGPIPIRCVVGRALLPARTAERLCPYVMSWRDVPASPTGGRVRHPPHPAAVPARA
jgi:signal peptidase I